MAAPAYQQAYTSSAISDGVIGTLGLFSFLGHAPVTAAVIIVFFAIVNLSCLLSLMIYDSLTSLNVKYILFYFLALSKSPCKPTVTNEYKTPRFAARPTLTITFSKSSAFVMPIIFNETCAAG